MASSSKVSRAITLGLRLVLGALFVYAAWTKLRAPWELFAMEVDAYQLLPIRAVEMVARTLPWFELVVGLLLIAGFWLRTASAAIALLLVGFFTLMVRAYVKGMEIPCGCFGANDIISWKTLLRDGSLLAASIVLVVLSFRARSKAPESSSLQDA